MTISFESLTVSQLPHYDHITLFQPFLKLYDLPKEERFISTPFNPQSQLIVLHIKCLHLGNLGLGIFHTMQIFRAPVSYKTLFRSDK